MGQLPGCPGGKFNTIAVPMDSIPQRVLAPSPVPAAVLGLLYLIPKRRLVSTCDFAQLIEKAGPSNSVHSWILPCLLP